MQQVMQSSTKLPAALPHAASSTHPHPCCLQASCLDPNTKITTYENRPSQEHSPTCKQLVIDDSKVSPNTPPWTSAASTQKTTEDKDNRGLSNCTQNKCSLRWDVWQLRNQATASVRHADSTHSYDAQASNSCTPTASALLPICCCCCCCCCFTTLTTCCSTGFSSLIVPIPLVSIVIIYSKQQLLGAVVMFTKTKSMS